MFVRPYRHNRALHTCEQYCALYSFFFLYIFSLPFFPWKKGKKEKQKKKMPSISYEKEVATLPPTCGFWPERLSTWQVLETSGGGEQAYHHNEASRGM